MSKLTAALFTGLIALFIVGCGDPGDMDDGMEDMQQQQQEGMENQGGMDDGMDGGMDGGMQDDTYGDDQEQGDQDW